MRGWGFFERELWTARGYDAVREFAIMVVVRYRMG